jgi:ribulose-5-phosphate 4-epimerase/fuculose-1-phosphate aldolase
MARQDLHCVMHTHTIAGIAVSTLAEGLLPINQASLPFYERVAYHDHEGLANDLDERERIVADLGPSGRAMILRNHGLLTAGASPEEAFLAMYFLERACQIQVTTLGMGARLTRSRPRSAIRRPASTRWRAAPGYRHLGRVCCACSIR